MSLCRLRSSVDSFVFRLTMFPFVKELSVRIVREFREHLENEISQKAQVVAQHQAEKRLELNGRVKEIVCSHKEDITKKVPGIALSVVTCFLRLSMWGCHVSHDYMSYS